MSFARNFRNFSRCSVSTADDHESAGLPRNGWALVSVLWTLAMLAMMAAAIEALTVSSARFERSALDHVRLEGDIDAGVARAIVGIGDARPEQRWRVDGVPQRFDYHNDTIVVSVQDENGRVDLNVADGTTITQLLVWAGMPTAEADTLSAAIVDWRTPVDDSDQSTTTTAGDVYAAAGRVYSPRHGPFQSIEELNLVLGMTPALYARIEPALTIYSRSDEVDFTVAPPVVQLALATLAQAGSGSTLAGAGGSQSNDDNDASADRPGIVQDVTDLAGHSFAIDVSAQHRGKRLSRQIVIEFTDDKRHPYLVEAWR
jgi:general secretion pathway protein K